MCPNSVQNNQLTSLPDECANLTNLMELNIADNHLRVFPEVHAMRSALSHTWVPCVVLCLCTVCVCRVCVPCVSA